MSELTARLALYGSIDRAVADGALTAERAADYLAPYGADPDGSAVGWYEALAEVVRAGAEPDASVLAPADPAAAVSELADLRLVDPIDAEHRLRALFLARRLLPADLVPDSTFLAAIGHVVTTDDVMNEMMTAETEEEETEEERPGRTDGPDPSAAAQLLARMIDDLDRFPGGEGYITMARTAADAGLISATTAQLAAATCDEGTTWFRVPGTEDLDVAAVVTSQVTVPSPAHTVAELRLRFHPGRWPKCLPSFWGAMDALDPPPPNGPSPAVDPLDERFVYREHVGDQKHASTWFTPVLEFRYDPVEGGPADDRSVIGFAIRYGMADPLPSGAVQDDRILIDDGELAVTRAVRPDGTTTISARAHKVLAMRPPLPSAGVAIFACASGWADQTKALVTGCLLNP